MYYFHLLLPPALLPVTSPPVTSLAITPTVTDRQAPAALLKRPLADTLEPSTIRALAKPQLSLDLIRNHAVQGIQLARRQVEMRHQQPDQFTITQEGCDVESR